MPQVAETTRHVRAISEDRINFSRSVRNEWICTVPYGTQPEDLLQPAYWKHVAARHQKPKEGDDIIVKCEARTWRATYEVRDIGPQHMKIALLRPDTDGVCWFNKANDPTTDTGTHYVKFIGPNSAVRHGVFRTSDDEEIKRGFMTSEAAVLWMNEHIKKLAA